MVVLLHRFWEFVQAEDGPTGTEYAILLGVIAIGAMASFAAFGDRMNDIYSHVDTAVNNAFAG